jgi:hypothetical protein
MGAIDRESRPASAGGWQWVGRVKFLTDLPARKSSDGNFWAKQGFAATSAGGGVGCWNFLA